MKTNEPQDLAVDILSSIIDQITYHPEARTVEAIPVGRSWMVRIQLHKADTPRVVGRGGEHIRALEVIGAAIGSKAGVNIRTQLLDPIVGLPERYAQFKNGDAWNSSAVLQLVADLGDAIFKGGCKVNLHDMDNATSNIEISVQRTESFQLVHAVDASLKILTNAIGKANGRVLFIDIAHEGPNRAGDLRSVQLSRQ